MIASLPMYDRPETRAANDRFWDGIREALSGTLPEHERNALPERLDRDGDSWEIWRSSDLVFSQTCGLPYRTRLADVAVLIGTPDYGLPGCPPGCYNSVFVMRSGDGRNDPADWPRLRLACNESGSQSGWAAPQAHLLSRGGGGFDRVTLTGSHRASAAAVAEGGADIAAIDAQTWRLIRRWDGFAASLKEVARTRPTPGLPFICAAGRPRGLLRDAVAVAIRELDAADRECLDLRGLADIPPEAYRETPAPPFPVDSAAAECR